MLTFSLLLLLVGVFIYLAQDRDRTWALLTARPVGADDLPEVPDGAAVAVRGPLRGERLSAPLSGRSCVWWAAAGLRPEPPEGADAGGRLDRQRLGMWHVSRPVVRLGDAVLLDPAAVRTYDVHASGDGREATVREGCAVEYALEDGEVLTVVGRVRHRADGLIALLPLSGQHHVRLYRHSPRAARLRLLAREAGAYACTTAALTLALAA
jgi:hypothetical protein